MAISSVFADATTRNRAYSMFWLSKRPGKWPFHRFFRTLRHGIGAIACSGCRSVWGNGSSAGFADTTTRNRAYSVFWRSKRPGKWPFHRFCGRYDTESGLQRVLADEASVEMAIPSVFPDTTTRNRAYSVLWLTKRPLKWPFRWFSRTLRHGIVATACSGCRSVRGNGASAGFCGHYDTESGLQRVLADEASVKMALPPVLRTLRHGIGATACSGCRSVR